ncbi:hypothetical protein [Roseovarius nanhaiticus]|uniref:Uncharacterized protein n=1 Tax=Roseovarius nanhaiticus TaxID=573024 RepID=A0A1N7F7R9_9RHOB|nr:hypothetical protein [Roseovarius nanhaiticus]SEK60127.1 hypothetical protein SAMN05216208_1318 [Roseovarius nanhaiticus]SIR96275.1 hypothetical protein SAMN05421666_0817 [Roseovarius nanhaiticus]
MTKLLTAFGAITLALTAPLAADVQNVLPTKGDEISKYRDAAGWVVRKNDTKGSCFASYRSESGAIVQFGFTDDETAGYLGLFGQNSAAIPSEQEVAFIANGNLYGGMATGVGASLEDGYEGGYVLVNNAEFVTDIETGEELVVFPETPNSYIVDMSGASTALYEVRKCTAEIGS